jgi:hypothetical protein
MWPLGELVRGLTQGTKGLRSLEGLGKLEGVGGVGKVDCRRRDGYGQDDVTNHIIAVSTYGLY